MSDHFWLSASGAHRWMACPGSPRMECGLPESRSQWADEGTDAHELAARCLLLELEPSAFLGETLPLGAVVSDEMVEAIGRYVEAVRRYAGPYEILVEQKVDLSQVYGVEGAFGTADAVIVDHDNGVVQVHDLKYGQGHKVHAARNPQLRSYGMGAVSSILDDRTARLSDWSLLTVIHQPRVGSDGWVDEELISLAEGLEWVEQARAAATAAQRDDAPLVPGEEQCRWCKAKATCPALAEFVTATVAVEFDDLTLTPRPLDALGPAEVARYLPHLNLIQDWCKAIGAQAKEWLLAGVEVPGYKLVAGRKGSRQWDDDTAVEAVLKASRVKQDLAWERRLMTPPAMEKVLAKAKPRVWAKVAEHITQSEGSPTMVPEDDKRPALQPTAEEFEDLTTEG